MAIIRSMGIGKASGSIDNITYSTIQGRTIARSKASFVHNPNTVLQQRQRNRMSDIVFLWRFIGKRFEKLWTRKAKYNSPYNAFVSKNIMRDDTYEVMQEDNNYELIEGFVLGEGTFQQSDLTFRKSGADVMARVTEYSPLENALKAGDILGCARFDVEGVLLDIDEHVITEDELLEGGSPYSHTFISDIEDYSLAAVYWYSPSRKQSTTCIVQRAV